VDVGPSTIRAPISLTSRRKSASVIAGSKMTAIVSPEGTGRASEPSVR
jgi:hypothetical protein